MSGKGFRKDKPPTPNIAFSDVPPLPGSIHNDTAELRAQLQQSHEALAELVQALTACKQHLTVAQKKLATLTGTNTSFHRKLTGIERKAATTNHLAYHDALTGLPNRRLLQDRLSQAIAQAARRKKRVALVFFDVDGFKTINDTLGHTGGDKLLQGVAQRLGDCLRAADTACRYGGDEFIVMLPELDDEQNTAVVENKIRTLLAAPYFIDGNMITVTLSIGTAIYPVDAKDHHELIKLADAAMYSRKANGGAVPIVKELTELVVN